MKGYAPGPWLGQSGQPPGPYGGMNSQQAQVRMQMEEQQRRQMLRLHQEQLMQQQQARRMQQQAAQGATPPPGQQQQQGGIPAMGSMYPPQAASGSYMTTQPSMSVVHVMSVWSERRAPSESICQSESLCPPPCLAVIRTCGVPEGGADAAEEGREIGEVGRAGLSDVGNLDLADVGNLAARTGIDPPGRVHPTRTGCRVPGPPGSAWGLRWDGCGPGSAPQRRPAERAGRPPGGARGWR